MGTRKQEGGPAAPRAAPESPVQGLPLPKEVFVTSIKWEFKTAKHFLRAEDPARLSSDRGEPWDSGEGGGKVGSALHTPAVISQTAMSALPFFAPTLLSDI